MAVCERCSVPIPEGTRGQTRRFCSDNCVKRACEDRKRGTCEDCGATLGLGSEWRSDWKRCIPCHKKHGAVTRRARLEAVAEMYNAGASHREIASALGYGPNSSPPELTEARRAGLIGYRQKRKAAA
jgi:hypothetical protein